jgi:LmbE family N-acetylglucosaminyl deacetylase
MGSALGLLSLARPQSRSLSRFVPIAQRPYSIKEEVMTVFPANELLYLFQWLASLGPFLCLGDHDDDIAIGMGGLLKTLTEDVQAVVHAAVLCSHGEPRVHQAINSLVALGVDKYRIYVGFGDNGLKDGFFNESRPRLRNTLRTLHQIVKPVCVFHHWLEDAHLDHRTEAEEGFKAHRPTPWVLSYYVPKPEPEPFKPDLFVQISAQRASEKQAILESYFPTEVDKMYCKRYVHEGLMREWGAQAGFREGEEFGYAEAFVVQKITLGHNVHTGWDGSPAPQGNPSPMERIHWMLGNVGLIMAAMLEEQGAA